MPVVPVDALPAREVSMDISVKRGCDDVMCAGLLDGIFADADDPFFDETYEPVLMPSQYRFVLFPVHSADLWALYKKASASFWVPDIVDVSGDLAVWNNCLDASERHFVVHVLALFASSKGVIYENIAQRFAGTVQLAEIRCFYGIQMAMETVHLEACSRLVETYITDAMQRLFLYNALENIPCIRRKADWMMRWIDDDHVHFRVRLVAFAAAEGIFFSGAFASLFWIEHKCVVPGLALTGRLIAHDLELHTAFACKLFGLLRLRPCEHTVHNIVGEAVEIEKEFMTEALPVSRIHMDPRVMIQYVEFTADRLLEGLGYSRLYNAQNPFVFMAEAPLRDTMASSVPVGHIPNGIDVEEAVEQTIDAVSLGNLS